MPVLRAAAGVKARALETMRAKRGRPSAGGADGDEAGIGGCVGEGAVEGDGFVVGAGLAEGGAFGVGEEGGGGGGGAAREGNGGLHGWGFGLGLGGHGGDGELESQEEESEHSPSLGERTGIARLVPMRTVLPIITLSMLLSPGCGKKPMDAAAFQEMTGEFVHSTLGLSPVLATSVGYHEHGGVKLDTLLDDLSAAGVEKQRKHWREWQSRLRGVEQAGLDAQGRADLELMLGQAELALLELDTIQAWRHNPTTYVELAGNALFTPYSVEYAPAPERWRHIIARLRGDAGTG